MPGKVNWYVIGTGTIGEPLIGLICDHKEELGVDDVIFHKRTPIDTIRERSRVNRLTEMRGAKLAVDKERASDFRDLGHNISCFSNEAYEKATVVIDCTPAGNRNKEEIYRHLAAPKGFIAQGSEEGFGTPYAYNINEKALNAGTDRFVQVVSCNTHSLCTLLNTVAMTGGENTLKEADFVCMRRDNDVTQDSGFVSSPTMGKHGDKRFGSHHAKDAWRVFETLGYDLNLFSSAAKLNSEFMHGVRFRIKLKKEASKEEVVEKLVHNPVIALTDALSANLNFSAGRDWGFYGRILSQTIVLLPTLHVDGNTVTGFCFTPQDGNSLLSSVSAALWRTNPNWQEVSAKMKVLNKYIYQEI